MWRPRLGPAAGGHPDGGRSPRLRTRLGLAVVAGLAASLLVVATIGLGTASPRGAADNGDGRRVYWSAGIIPDTPDSFSNWKGGVVLGFNRFPVSPDPYVSSAVPILRLAATGADKSWSLTRLGWLYAALAGLVTAVAAYAATAAGLVRALLLVPPLAPLADADYSRFFISTFAEPAGLLGSVALFSGLAVLVATRPVNRIERAIGLSLVGAGGLVAATAKVSYAPLLGVAILAAAITAVSLRREGRRWQDRVVGPLAAVLIAVLAWSPMSQALAWQDRSYPGVNAFDVVYTTVLTEIPEAAPQLGLPPAAVRHAGQGFFPSGPDAVPGADVVLRRPDQIQHAGWRILAQHPAALMRAVGIAMQATEGRALSYLPAQPAPPGAIDLKWRMTGDQGMSAASLRSWLDAMRFPWWPSLLALAGVLAGVAGTVRRGRTWSPFALVSGVAAASAVAMAPLCVLGDGYFEIAKHMWLAAYLLDVSLLALLGAAIAGGHQRWAGRRRQLDAPADLRPQTEQAVTTA